MPETTTDNNSGRGKWGYFAPGNTFSKGQASGNPLAKKHYELRKRFSDLVTDDEFASFRKTVVEGMLDRDPVCLKLYAELVMGRSTIPVELSCADDASAKSEVEDTMRLVLAALENHPTARSDVADALLRGSQPKVIEIEVNADGLRN